MIGNIMVGETLAHVASLAQSHVLAHQGGWDEVVLVGAPVVLFGGLLIVAKHRAQHIVEQRGIEQRGVEQRGGAAHDADHKLGEEG